MVDTFEFTRDADTEYLYEQICLCEPIDPQCADDVRSGVEMALQLEAQPLFRQGLAQRLTQLGTPCSAQDTELMLAQVKQRFSGILGKSCPRTVREWIRGTTPGDTNRLNNYDLCWALEMDCKQTADFFQKCFLTLPFNVKSRVDAVFLYCLHHKKPYSAVCELLEGAKGFVSQQAAHTHTSQIFASIIGFDDDEKFSKYLSTHCYDNEQQFQLAREIINGEIRLVKEKLRRESSANANADRLNSLTVDALLGYRYQSSKNDTSVHTLPKHFTQSLPTDVTLGKMIAGEKASYETLRKTLMLLRFYNFYSEAENTDSYAADNNLMDFYEELNETLNSCGFAQITLRHTFDCLLFYCANSLDPILTMHFLNERN